MKQKSLSPHRQAVSADRQAEKTLSTKRLILYTFIAVFLLVLFWIWIWLLVATLS